MGQLDGKVALISGGARGMGAEHVRQFIAQGARVVFGDVRDDEGKALAAEVGSDGHYLHHDVTSEDEWAAAVSETVSRYGSLDILVNNAGIVRFGKIIEQAPEEFRKILDINLFGCWLGIRAVAAVMSDGGSIVNISSVEGYAGAAGLSAYSASKFALRGLTKVAARELGPRNIRVNSVHPGGIATPMNTDMVPDLDPDQPFVPWLPIPRWGRAAEVTRVVIFLASDAASYCTGSEVLVDGGLLTGPGY
ncbi:SDR family oxidoreductase [Trebonia kvetii]|uniref:SDR family oxidoreductase n=1 Tax=Trebonia kvetii TaxID=2480626 RepID=A0A6P2BVL9_9ACTN|nr:glucose 1-dehydrogenase [Trebonia kvetii]TVZ02185.1 SDR family oxidoreductase [Trebonia kvetii]